MSMSRGGYVQGIGMSGGGYVQGEYVGGGRGYVRHGILWDTVNKRAVCIPLECFLVEISIHINILHWQCGAVIKEIFHVLSLCFYILQIPMAPTLVSNVL